MSCYLIECSQRCLHDAEELKEEGNEEFRRKNWEDALISYQSALRRLPPRKQKRKLVAEIDPNSSDDEEPSSQTREGKSSVDERAGSKKEEGPELDEDPEEARIVKARAVLNSNIGACYMKMVRQLYVRFVDVSCLF